MKRYSLDTVELCIVFSPYTTASRWTRSSATYCTAAQNGALRDRWCHRHVRWHQKDETNPRIKAQTRRDERPNSNEEDEAMLSFLASFRS